jgi:hypothetical protein
MTSVDTQCGQESSVAPSVVSNSRARNAKRNARRRRRAHAAQAQAQQTQAPPAAVTPSELIGALANCFEHPQRYTPVTSSQLQQFIHALKTSIGSTRSLSLPVTRGDARARMFLFNAQLAVQHLRAAEHSMLSVYQFLIQHATDYKNNK